MADLNLDLNYFDHLKTRRLVNRLKRGADLLPIRLWCYCGKHYAKDGRLIGHTAEEIEAQVGWWGKPGECVAALLEVGFLDQDSETFVVHGWLERSGHLSVFSERARKAANARWNRGSDASSNASSIAQASSSNAPTLPTKPTIPTNMPAEVELDPDPSIELAKHTGIETMLNPKGWTNLRRLIAIDGYESALAGIRTAQGKGINGPAAISWAEKMVAGNKAKRELKSDSKQPRSSVAVREDQ